MEKRISVAEYLGMPETNKPQELVYGILREPDAPGWGHQEIVTRVAALLHGFARRTKLGAVCVSPIDVVFDRSRALVLQPDIVFVSQGRLRIIDEKVWGPPDLIVEVLSPKTAKRDRTRKREWYRKYGVKEYWLVHPRGGEVTIITLGGEPRAGQERVYRGSDRLCSRVLPGFRPSVKRLLGG